jgi:hypothetical protein
MGDTTPLLHQALGLAVLAALLLYLSAKRRRKAAKRLDRMVRELPEFLHNPKPFDGSADAGNTDPSLDIHPWGGRPRRPPPKNTE